jgi:hypothetical protein
MKGSNNKYEIIGTDLKIMPLESSNNNAPSQSGSNDNGQEFRDPVS